MESREKFFKGIAAKILERKKDLRLSPIQNEIANLQLMCHEFKKAFKINGKEWIFEIIDPQEIVTKNLTSGRMEVYNSDNSD